jgi:hypothetical protein
MSEHRQELSERLIDLCCDHAVGDQSSSDLHELNTLDQNHSARAAFQSVAAQIDAAYAQLDPVDLPAGLEDRLMATLPGNAPAQQAVKPGLKLSGTPAVMDAAPSGASSDRSPGSAWFPWLVAAASITLAAIVVFKPTPAGSLTPSQARDQLIASTDPAGLLRYSWTATEDPSVVGAVTGELIWDEATDQGYMTISGLEVNDPSSFQYQLWIFDATRPQGELPQFEGFDGLLSQRPIDGGVFDITSTGEVVIPIDAKLKVRQGVAFAVTVEQPGGVVVSDRTRVPLLAIPQG